MAINIQQLAHLGETRRFRIGTLSRETGATDRQIRYWINHKLVDPPYGRAGGARYSPEHTRQVLHVVHCLAHGQKLDSIAHHKNLAAAPDLSDSGWTDGEGAIPRHNVWRHTPLTGNVFIATRSSRSELEQKIVKEMHRVARRMLLEAIELKGKTTRKSQ